MLKTLFAVLIAFTVGFLGYSAYIGLLPRLTQSITMTVQPTIDTVKPTLTQLWNTWNSLPKSIQTIILAGVPLMVSVFMMWTKNRAMQKLEETRLQATQLQGEKLEAEAQVQQLQGQVSTLQAPQAEISRLSGSLAEAQGLLSEQKRSYELQLAAKQATIDDLHRVIQETKQKTVEVTKVK